MKKLAATFVLHLLSFPAFAIPIINTDGLLTGATDIDVMGMLYDVSFVDGTCVAVFSGCDELTDFTFPSDSFPDQPFANAASQALLESVFVGIFDTDPDLTFGCVLGGQCDVHTPVGFLDDRLVTSFAGNNPGANADSVTGALLQNNGGDFSLSDQQVWAVWTLAQIADPDPDTDPVSVPEPNSILLLLIGIIALALARRNSFNAQGA